MDCRYWIQSALIKAICCISLFLAAPQSGAQSAGLKLDETPARPGEWGYRPDIGAELRLTPPAFSWRPQKGIVSWEIECLNGGGFKKVVHRGAVKGYNVYCPSKAFFPGASAWRNLYFAFFTGQRDRVLAGRPLAIQSDLDRFQKRRLAVNRAPKAGQCLYYGFGLAIGFASGLAGPDEFQVPRPAQIKGIDFGIIPCFVVNALD